MVEAAGKARDITLQTMPTSGRRPNLLFLNALLARSHMAETSFT